MRICIIGTGSVGKTTLANAFAEDTGLPLIEEKMRVSGKMFEEIIGDTDLRTIVMSKWYPHFVFDLIKRQIDDELEYGCDFVSDRSVLDYFLYFTQLEDGRHPNAVNIMEPFVRKHIAEAYDLVVYIPIKFGMEDNGYRMTDIGFQKHMDKLFLDEVNLLENGYKLQSVSLPDRVEELRRKVFK